MERNVMYHYTNPVAWEGMVNGREGYMVEHPLTGEWVNSKSVKG